MTTNINVRYTTVVNYLQKSTRGTVDFSGKPTFGAIARFFRRMKLGWFEYFDQFSVLMIVYAFHASILCII